MPQVVFERALLDRDLRSRVQVLHLAAAAGAGMQAEMRTRRPHALRTLARRVRERALLPVVLAPVYLYLHPLGRQRAFDEDHLALGVVRHALRFEVERFDLEPFPRRCHSQAARYSAQCGSSVASSVSRASAISRSCSASVKPPRIFWKRQYSSQVFMTSVSQ